MNEDEMQEYKVFFKEHLEFDAKDFMDAVEGHNIDLAFGFVKLAYAVGVKDGIIEAYSKKATP